MCCILILGIWIACWDPFLTFFRFILIVDRNCKSLSQSRLEVGGYCRMDSRAKNKLSMADGGTLILLLKERDFDSQSQACREVNEILTYVTIQSRHAGGCCSPCEDS